MASKAGSTAASKAQPKTQSKGSSRSGSRKKPKNVSKPTAGARSKAGRSRSASRKGDVQEAPADEYDFDRLARAITALVVEQRSQRGENAALRRKLSDRDRQVKNLNDELIELNQRRSDAMKRLDDLIAQVDGFEARALRAGG
jgi:chromosome segregation ATPase